MRLHLAIIGSMVLIAAAPSAAQQWAMPDSTLPTLLLPAPARSSSEPRLQISTGRFEESGRILRKDGLIGSIPLTDNLQLGLGRYRVIDPEQPKRAPAAHESQPRQRNVVAVGMKFSF